MARNSDAVRDKCISKGGIVFRQNKHYVGWVEFNGRKISKVIVPMGRKPITTGTYRSIAGQMLLSVEELDQFVDCTFTKDQFCARVREKVSPTPVSPPPPVPPSPKPSRKPKKRGR